MGIFLCFVWVGVYCVFLFVLKIINKGIIIKIIRNLVLLVMEIIDKKIGYEGKIWFVRFEDINVGEDWG